MRLENMTQLYRHAPPHAPLFSAVASTIGSIKQELRDTEPYVLYWWVFTACVSISHFGNYFADSLGWLYYPITVAGAAGCGWMWLLSRSLFRPARRPERWALLTVCGIIVVESYWHFTSALPAGGMTGEMRRIGENAASLICIGAISMVFVEALSGFSSQLSQAERRFRQIFATAFGAVIIIALVWASNAGEAAIATEWRDATLTGCALFAIAASRLAVNFRRRSPLPTPRMPSRTYAKDAADDSALARRIVEAVEAREVFTTPNLKIGQFAELIGEQEYKVTQCITGRLQYRNFNHFINSYRIDRAKRILSSARHSDQPILSIAFDCGFGSIGPFNRAFKEYAGMTPREFRAACCGQVQRAESN